MGALIRPSVDMASLACTWSAVIHQNNAVPWHLAWSTYSTETNIWGELEHPNWTNKSGEKNDLGLEGN